MKLLTYFVTLLSLSLCVQSASAAGITESQMLLQEAMMESNADYNRHKKAFNQEEMDRMENWDNRAEIAIDLDGDQQDLIKAEEYQALRQEVLGQGRAVSSQ